MKQRLYDIINRVTVPLMFTVTLPVVLTVDYLARWVDYRIRLVRCRLAWRRIERGLEPIADNERLR